MVFNFNLNILFGNINDRNCLNFSTKKLLKLCLYFSSVTIRYSNRTLIRRRNFWGIRTLNTVEIKFRKIKDISAIFIYDVFIDRRDKLFLEIFFNILYDSIITFIFRYLIISQRTSVNFILYSCLCIFNSKNLHTRLLVKN